MGIDFGFAERIVLLDQKVDRLESASYEAAADLVNIRATLDDVMAALARIEASQVREEDTDVTFADDLIAVKQAQLDLDARVQAVDAHLDRLEGQGVNVDQLRDELQPVKDGIANVSEGVSAVADIAARDEAIDTGAAATGDEILRQLTPTPPPPSP